MMYDANVDLLSFLQGGVISSNKQWAEVCGSSSLVEQFSGFTDQVPYTQNISAITLAFVVFLGLFLLRGVAKAVGKKVKNLRGKSVRLEGDEVSSQDLTVYSRDAEYFRSLTSIQHLQ